MVTVALRICAGSNRRVSFAINRAILKALRNLRASALGFSQRSLRTTITRTFTCGGVGVSGGTPSSTRQLGFW